MESSKNLNNLPIEVLDQIFRYLNESDKCQLADVTPSLGKAFVYHTKKFYEYIQLNSRSSRNMTIVVPLCGPIIRRIEIETSFDAFGEMRDLIDTHCEILKVIDIQVCSTHVEKVKEFLCTSLKAKSVDIHIRCDSQNLSKLMPVLKDRPNLKCLRMFNILKEDYRVIRQLVNLETLGVRVGPLHTKAFLSQLLLPLKNLRHLEIRNTEWPIPISIRESPFCNLLTLEIQHCIVKSLPSFPNLKSISLVANFLETMSSKMFLKWVSNHRNTLEQLKFDLAVGVFKSKDFFKMLRACKRLRLICINTIIENICEADFVTTFLSILKENGVSPEDRCVLKTSQMTCEALKILLRDIPDSNLLQVFSYAW